MSTTQLNWHTDDYDTFYAATDDPRILAVIQRDSEPYAPWGDALAPAYHVEHRGEWSVSQAGDTFNDGQSDEIAERWISARSRFRYAAGYRWNGLSGQMIHKSEAMLERWLSIFHDSRAELVETQDETVLIFDTPNYRAAMGTPDDYDRAEYLAGDRAEWRAYFDGDVYGIGYAVQTERVLHNPDDAPGGPDFNPDDWTVTIECWGFSGEDYAKESAAAFEASAPELPVMLVIA